VRVELGNVVERHEMKVDVRHAEAFDGNAYPISVGGLFFMGSDNCFAARKMLE
jgi:hypothetical protein